MHTFPPPGGGSFLPVWASALCQHLFCSGVWDPALLSDLLPLCVYPCLFALALGTTLRNPSLRRVNFHAVFGTQQGSSLLANFKSNTTHSPRLSQDPALITRRTRANNQGRRNVLCRSLSGAEFQPPGEFAVKAFHWKGMWNPCQETGFSRGCGAQTKACCCPATRRDTGPQGHGP